MCHPPRFDKSEVDPLSLKKTLVKIANTNFHQLWLDSPLKDKIFIGEHRLDCSNREQIHRYTDVNTKRYDGIHMYGKSGQRAYTESVLSIMKMALLHQDVKSSASSSPVSSPVSSSASSTSEDKDIHTYCPQAQYLNGHKSKQSGYPRYHHTVKDSNRFRTFNFNQGNE